MAVDIADSIYDIEVRGLDGQRQSMRQYQGQVLLIVNVASLCGFTPQYRILEAWYQRYRKQGFSVLGFPCNQFARQEPDDAASIRAFCDTRYQLTFPLFEKIKVNGAAAHPLYQFLKAQRRGCLGRIPWNFTKFLVDRSGRVVRRYSPIFPPRFVERNIKQLIA